MDARGVRVFFMRYEDISRGIKDMRMTKEYKEAIATAKANLADLRERGEDAIGGDALEFIDSFLTPEEIAASNLRVAMMIELDHARAGKSISKEKVAELSSVN